MPTPQLLREPWVETATETGCPLSTGQPSGLETLVPEAAGHGHKQGMKAFLLPGNLHFTLTLAPLGLQGQRNHLEAWLVRLGGHGAQQADPAGQGETGLSMCTTLKRQGSSWGLENRGPGPNLSSSTCCDLARHITSPSCRLVTCGTGMIRLGCGRQKDGTGCERQTLCLACGRPLKNISCLSFHPSLGWSQGQGQASTPSLTLQVLADAVRRAHYGPGIVPSTSCIVSFTSHNHPFVDTIFSPNLRKLMRPW